MINLDSYLNGTIDIQLGGNLIKVRELNAKQVQKFVELDELEPHDRIEEQLKLLTETLNKNTSSVKFTLEEIKEFPMKLTHKLLELLLSPETDPN